MHRRPHFRYTVGKVHVKAAVEPAHWVSGIEPGRGLSGKWRWAGRRAYRSPRGSQRHVVCFIQIVP